MLGDPGLPPGLSEGDEQDVGPRRPDPIEQGGMLVAGEFADLGAFCADDADPGEAPGQGLGERLFDDSAGAVVFRRRGDVLGHLILRPS